MTRLYLDTSIAYAALVGVPEARRWFDEATREGSLISSRLLRTELTRVLRRDRIPVGLRSHVLDHVDTVPVTEQILTLAEAITEHVKTLDAVHLATALSLGTPTTIVSHDTGMLTVAARLGLGTLDPRA